MPRKRKPKVESRGPIRVRAEYQGKFADAWRTGYGDWHIRWFADGPNGRMSFGEWNLGVTCVNPLDVWVPVPDGAVGYQLLPTPTGCESEDVMPIPPLDHPDSKHPRATLVVEPDPVE